MLYCFAPFVEENRRDMMMMMMMNEAKYQKTS
jgi:hypothetical protein